MIITLSTQKYNSTISLINSYKKKLTNPRLTFFEVQEIADHLGEILQTHHELSDDIIEILNQIEIIEETGRKKDQKLLGYFNKLDLELKQLELQLDVLSPSIIEEKLKDLQMWLESLQKHSSYQNEFFKKEIRKHLVHLQHIMFSFHFPLYEKIKKKNSALLNLAKDLFLNRKKSLKQIDPALKTAIEKKTKKPFNTLIKDPEMRRMLIPHIVIEYVYFQEMIG